MKEIFFFVDLICFLWFVFKLSVDLKTGLFSPYEIFRTNLKDFIFCLIFMVFGCFVSLLLIYLKFYIDTGKIVSFYASGTAGQVRKYSATVTFIFVYAAISETCVLFSMYTVLDKIQKINSTMKAFIVAVLFSSAHIPYFWWKNLSIFIMFFMMSILYNKWKNSYNYANSALKVSLLHATFNLIVLEFSHPSI